MHAAPTSEPRPATALLGGALAGSGPETSPCIDGLSLVTGMVIPQPFVCSNHVHDDGRLEQEAGKTSASLGPSTSCLQSQIGPCRYLRRHGTTQVEAASSLSVVVRPGPLRTAVNGTLVARPVRMTLAHRGAVGSP